MYVLSFISVTNFDIFYQICKQTKFHVSIVSRIGYNVSDILTHPYWQRDWIRNTNKWTNK